MTRRTIAVASLATALLICAGVLVLFISGISSAWARGLNIDCGCFSKGGNLAEGETPSYLPSIAWDVLYLAMAIFLIVYPISRFSLDGREVSVRFRITPLDDGTIRFEQAFSPDDGATWETNWIAVDTRLGNSH